MRIINKHLQNSFIVYQILIHKQNQIAGFTIYNFYTLKNLPKSPSQNKTPISEEQLQCKKRHYQPARSEPQLKKQCKNRNFGDRPTTEMNTNSTNLKIKTKANKHKGTFLVSYFAKIILLLLFLRFRA